MAATATVPSQIEGSMPQYREYEQALWRHYGVAPKERFVELETPRVRVRVIEVGSGKPLLFVHGTAGPSPIWAPLVRELSGFRCLMLDRPGWAFSSPLDYSKHHYGSVIADLLDGVMHSLHTGPTTVVGASIGDVWAMRLAARTMSKVDRIVLLGGGPLVAGVGVPPFIRLIASPLGWALVRIPTTSDRVRSMLRQAGHGPSVEAKRIPDVFIDWRAAVDRYTDSMRNERAMVSAIVSGRNYRPGLLFDDAELAAIAQPTLMVYGTADPVGGVELWRRFTRTMPAGELDLLDGAGHCPWLDDPSHVASQIRRFVGD
jgi:pimeloyl-ACP methyl ester carboxylesterase